MLPLFHLKIIVPYNPIIVVNIKSERVCFLLQSKYALIDERDIVIVQQHAIEVRVEGIMVA